MNPLEILLAGFAAAGPLLLVVRRRASPHFWRAIAFIEVVVASAGLIFASHRKEIIPLAVVALAVAGLALLRARKVAETARRRGPFKILLAWLAAVVVTLVALVNAAVIEIFDPLANASFYELFDEPATPDFSKLEWPAAFEQLHAHLSRAYAMGERKRVDWKALHDVAAPRIEAAAAAGDRAAYYLALREYLWSFHDGHVELAGDDGGARETAIQGGFGFALIRLDDGSTIAHVVVDGGPAEVQGMHWGATILEWNGAKIDDAIAGASTVWAPSAPATAEGVRLARTRLLTRAPVGTQVAVAFRNPDEESPRSAALVAVDDRHETSRLAVPPRGFSLKGVNIDWRVLDEGMGYVKIRGELPTLRQLLPDWTMRRAVRAFTDAGVRGIVIDVRGNVGGADKLVPRMMGYFVDRPVFYEQATFFSDATARFEQEAAGTLWTTPRDPHFGGPIAVLVDDLCVSSGEGFALVARQRERGHVVGQYGTYGSFGMSGAEVVMPGGLTVGYPNGQSLDADGRVQLDSDSQLSGGIAPDVRVPVTLDTVKARFKDGRDVVLEAAIQTLE